MIEDTKDPEVIEDKCSLCGKKITTNPELKGQDICFECYEKYLD